MYSLEPCAGKIARTVLRGGGCSSTVPLPDYHRVLRRLVAIELKLDKFRAADKGQMELYLRWLDKYERQPWEDSPLGLILCAGKSDEQIELLQLDKSGIRVAAYLTELPPIELLRRKLHEAIVLAKDRFEPRQLALSDEDK